METDQETSTADKRHTILESARALCQNRDLESVKMAEIATRARVSKGTLYRFFSSKEDLLCAMVLAEEEAKCKLVTALVDANETAPEKIQAYVQGTTQGQTAENVALNIQALGMAGRNPESAERVYGRLREMRRAQQAGIESIIQQGIESGQFKRKLDAFAIATALMSFCDGFAYRAAFDESYRSEDTIARVFSQVVSLALPDVP